MDRLAAWFDNGFFGQCLKYRTDRHKDIRRIEKLNSFFLRLSCEPDVTAESAAAIAAIIEEEGQQRVDLSRPVPLAVLMCGSAKLL